MFREKVKGKHLCALLQKLGYPIELRSEELDWVFEDAQLYPFVESIINSITWKNFMAPEDMKEYEQLKQLGHTLEGEELDEALHNAVEEEKQSEQSLEQLNEEVERLRQEHEWMTKKVERKKSQRDFMESNINTLNFKLSKVNLSIQQKEEKLANVQQTLAESNSRFNLEIDRLRLILVQLLDNFSVRQEMMQEFVPEGFLASINLAPYAIADDQFIRQLKVYLEKQFHVQQELQKMEQEEADNLRGLSRNQYEQYSKELSRLKNALLIGEEQHLIANIENEKAKMVLERVKMQSIWRDSYFQMSTIALNEKLESTRKQIAILQEGIMDLQDDVKSLLREMSELQVLPVLEENYDLKLARQDYQISKQDQFLRYLIEQKSRHELLTIAFKLEEQRSVNTFNLLKAVENELTNLQSAFRDRMSQYERIITGSKFDTSQPMINSGDSFLQSAYNILKGVDPANPVSKAQKAISMKELFAKAEQVANHIQANKEEIKRLKQQRESHMKEMNVRYENMNQIIFSKSSTEPNLLPVEVQEAINKLEQVSDNNSDFAKAILRHQQSKAADIEQDVQSNLYIKVFAFPHELPAAARDKSNPTAG